MPRNATSRAPRNPRNAPKKAVKAATSARSGGSARPGAAKRPHAAPRPPAPDEAALAALVAGWFASAARDLPWRRRRGGYAALVSELMLQQTQVSRVLEKFEPFLERFPTPAALAAASEDEVLAAWQGLGYYRRARLLHAAAKACVARHDGEVPPDLESLLELPGVGRYTAGAIASIVHGAPAPIVDGNVARVLLRVFGRDGRPGDRATDAWAWERADAFARGAGDEVAAANEGLMELGATVCTPAAPRCAECPLAARCRARAEGRVDSIPSPKARAARRELVLVTARIARTDGAVLLEQRPRGGLWGGLWQPPTVEHPEGAELAPRAAAQALGLDLALVPVGIVPFATTHRSVRFVVLEARVRGRGAALATAGRRWVGAHELASHALSNAAKKVIGKM